MPKPGLMRTYFLSLVVLLLCTISCRAEDRSAKDPVMDAPGYGEEDLLAAALDESVPLKYEPTYLRDDEDEGQKEEENPEDALVIERAYFFARDHDGDGGLSREEFLMQLNDPALDDLYGESAEGESRWKVADRGRPLPSKEHLLWGKDWTARMSPSEEGAAFNEFDKDKDGIVSWKEWKAYMFHEEAQMPEIRDGLDVVHDPSGLRDDEINPEDLAEIKERFHKADVDKKGTLTTEEVFLLIKDSHDNPMYPDGVENYTRPTDEFMRETARELVEAHDKDADGEVSFEEWMAGGGH